MSKNHETEKKNSLASDSLEFVADGSCPEGSKVPREYMMIHGLQRLLQHIHLCFKCTSIKGHLQQWDKNRPHPT